MPQRLAIFCPARTATPTAPDSLNNLPTVVIYRANEYPSLEAERAAALCLFNVSVVSSAGCSVETLAGGRYPYLVHSGHPFFCGPGLGVRHHQRGRFFVYRRIIPHSRLFCNIFGDLRHT